MTRFIDSLESIADGFDAIVLDQWGVLHDGSAPYPGAVQALESLRRRGTRLSVLSNSGKRSSPNRDRIIAMGFAKNLFEVLMTSGEALWRDVANGRVPEHRFFPVERSKGDATAWARDLDVCFVSDVRDAEALLLMGLHDDAISDEFDEVFDHALSTGKPVFCSNPDRASPRHGGRTVVSPGELAHRHAERGGHVRFYGKPHSLVFQAIEDALQSAKLLMVGDSLEHDIAGGHKAGWSTALVQGGLYSADFSSGDAEKTLSRLVKEKSTPAPDFRLEWLR